MIGEIKSAFRENRLAIALSVAILLISLVLGYVLEPFLHSFLNPVVEDLTHIDETLKLGETVTLRGKHTENYVRYRNTKGDENQNNLRMKRQKSYLDAFIAKAMEKTKEDISTPIKMLNSIQGYSQTDFSADKITYLASLLINTGLSTDKDMIKIPGETVMGETYAEYIVDTDALFEIVLDTYYTKVTN